MVAKPRVKKAFCTTREAADLLGVSLRTTQLWVERGLLDAWKTEGGHRRIARKSIENLLAVSPARAAGNADPVDPPLTVMVVEDEATLRMLYESNLRRWPMRPNIISAGDGYEAMVKLGHVMPDLLITDLHMPGMDGFRMLHTIRAIAEYDAMRIVVVTGLDEEEVNQRGGLPEGIPVFSKPIPFPRLREFAVELAARRQAPAEAEAS